MILSDRQIKALGQSLIFPFHSTKITACTLSWGLQSFGYDVRLGYEFVTWTPRLRLHSHRSLHYIDPGECDESDVTRHFLDGDAPPHYIYPGSFILAKTIEVISLPKNLTGMIKDKSTYARCGVAVQNTVIEAGWKGNITLEISNHSSFPVRLYPGEGIAQIIFLQGEVCETSYNGKYQYQDGVTLPK